MKLVAASLLLALFACIGLAAPAQAQSRLAITVAPIPSTDMTPLYYAIQEKMFEKAGLDVTLYQTNSGAASVQAVVGHGADIGFGNVLALAIAYSKSIPVTIISSGSMYRSEIANDLLLMPPDGTAKTAKDLEGKTIAVTGLHDLLGLGVVTWLTQNGADPSKVNFVEMPASTMAPALAAKRVDFVTVYEPFLGTMLRSGAAKKFAAPFNSISPNFMSSAWFALSPWATQHKDAVIAFSRVMSQAATYVDSHYESMLPLVAQFTKLPVETLKGMAPIYDPPKLEAKNIQPVLDAAVKAKDLATPIKAQDMLFPGVP